MSATAEKTTTSTLTYEQYLAEGEINRRYEIIDGVRLWMSNPTVRHQDVLFNVAAFLKNFGRTTGLGRMVVAACDVLVTYQPLQVRQPDVLFISHERFGNRNPLDPSALSPAPELVVEILSPSDTRSVLRNKIRDYCAVDIQECWVVNLALQTVEVLCLTPAGEQSAGIYGQGDTLASTVFPTLSLSVSDIFAQ